MKEKIGEGKTKVIWKLDEKTVEIESKDMITAGDGEKKDQIKTKGVWSNNTTCNVFELLEKHGVNTHFIRKSSDNSFTAVLCEMFPIEVVMRRTATGSFLKRNLGTEDGTVFDEIVIEFFLKDDARHDPYILITRNDGQPAENWELYRPKQPINEAGYLESIDPIWNENQINYVKKQAEKVFLILEAAFQKLDINLIDMKIEFGKHVPIDQTQPDDVGIIIVADVIDNDSWRIRTKEGEQLDKQLYRDGEKLETVSNKYEIVSKLSDKLNSVEIDL
jgi:phosphoribosylaminoimidazole-succinocarboxamide synthase